ncbi:hypothetical protein Rsub_03100 [Raphidocelis subcapitata]|uniref:Uncharacterized protein n=1 Tax=Raphidocelis subcapitata TaxID=307507 RepID=A0A2V0NU03_9CHLO|nr:hypothetical protein Rsub_03100 [Raphidocelis subcapitata]|eukprot:GBF90799.1 hypothetical protein Rsub_03100 [Raphidocelis subcapitata]
MKKQGNWWLHALVHYDPSGEALLFHRVTGEVRFGHKAPVDEVLTPPLPVSWSMWWMGYGPSNELQHTLEVMNFNLTALEASAPPGQACPLLLWAAYWTLRTHGIATDRRPELEAACDGALRAQYGAPAAALIRGAGLLERPLRLVVNKKWDEKIDGEWKQPRAPLLAVPLNMTAGYRAWLNLNESVAWANDWAPKNLPILGMKPAGRRRGLLLWRRPGRQLQAAAAPTGGGSGGGGGGVAAAA